MKQIDIIGKAHIQNNCDYNMVTANIYLNLFILWIMVRRLHIINVNIAMLSETLRDV